MQKYNVILKKDKKWNGEEFERSFRSKEDIKRVCIDFLHLDERIEETLVLFATDSNGLVIGVFEVSIGETRMVPLNMRGIITRLLLCNAVAFFMVHNHPGNGEPSAQDKECSKKIKKLAASLSIEMIDSLILKANGEVESVIK